MIGGAVVVLLAVVFAVMTFRAPPLPPPEGVSPADAAALADEEKLLAALKELRPALVFLSLRPLAGVECSLEFGNSVYRHGDSLTLWLNFRNTSRQPVRLATGKWGALLLLARDGELLPPVLLGHPGMKHPRNKKLRNFFLRRNVVLPPGGKTDTSYLLPLPRLRPGSCAARVLLFRVAGSGASGRGTECVRSTTVGFRIRE